MARARRICPKPGCPQAATKRYCTEHEREYERARGSREQRGYGHAHRKLRVQWQERIDRGSTPCARCGQLIHPSTPWHLDHHDNDRTKYLGPSHKRCNERAGGQAAHQ